MVDRQQVTAGACISRREVVGGRVAERNGIVDYGDNPVFENHSGERSGDQFGPHFVPIQ